MSKEQPSARPLNTGGESGGGNYAEDVQARTPHEGKYEGGQSIKNYHGPAKGGESNAATKSNPDRPLAKETDSGGL